MTALVTPKPEIPRDRYGRPLVIPPSGGKPVPYTRCTTFIDVIEDKYNLQQWEKRMVATGLAKRPDLMLGVTAHLDDKAELNRLCEQAKEAAASSAAATTGTALHALTEQVDRGRDLPPLTPPHLDDLEAYRQATARLRAIHIEQFVVLDTLQIGGTPDRIVQVTPQLREIADVKTGSIEYGHVKIAAQLAVYARSMLYDPATGDRTRHDASLLRGLVIHLPAGQGICTLYEVDLELGWRAVLAAKETRALRGIKFADVMTPAGDPTPIIDQAEQRGKAITAMKARARLEQHINAADTPDEIRQLWAANETDWTDQLTAAARKRIAALQEKEKNAHV